MSTNNPGALRARRDGRKGWLAAIITPNAIISTDTYHRTLADALDSIAQRYLEGSQA